MRFILASASPRRQELIALICENVLCVPSGVDEIIPDGITVSEIPLELARQKAEAVAKLYPKDIVIGCDTGVISDGTMLGKPRDKEDAKQMLSDLSGKVHQVITGCSIWHKGKSTGFSNVTDVEFFELTDDEIEVYVNTDEPYDKAGSYGIQGKASLFVKGIQGDYFNVVGLPVAELSRQIKKFLAEDK